MNIKSDLKGRWVLAFDSSCDSCRRLSDRVQIASSGNLETVPLARREVQDWISETLGEKAKPEPTLFQVTPESTRAWTGRSMVLPLVRHLGVAASFRVVRALGTLRDEPLGHEGDSSSPFTRKRFLQLGSGAVVAGALVFTGQLPAYARSPANAWVRANRDRLPSVYADFARYPLDYRRVIFAELSPGTRSALWSEHFDHYRENHPSLTPRQSDLLETARSAFTPSAMTSPVDEKTAKRFDALRTRFEHEFGAQESRAIIAVLGPDEAREQDAPDCRCAINSDWCGTVIRCSSRPCNYLPFGCGTGLVYPCTGLCDS